MIPANFHSLSIEERDRILTLQELQRGRHELYREYSPNGKCARFIQMIGENRFFINLFIAANGVGKTAVLSNILANICFPPVKWFNYPLYHNFPYLPQGRIVSDTTTITKQIVPELHKWFPAGQYEAKRADKHFDSAWMTKGRGKPRFTFDIMTYEQDVKQFESVSLGFAVFDEPPPQDIWKATISRMRRGGIVICGFTPLDGSAFFYDNYVMSPDAVRF